jgi:hypothetical protein
MLFVRRGSGDTVNESGFIAGSETRNGEYILGALRRHQIEEQDGQGESRPNLSRPPQKSTYPKWLVLSGLVAYCAVFWVVIWAAGTWGVSVVRVAMAGGLE